jgi:PST family polysaccharide transporter
MVLRIFPSLVIQSVYPNASKLFKNDRARFYSSSSKVFYTTLLISLAISFAVFFLAPTVIYLLSREFLDESIRILKILAFVPVLASLNIFNIIVFLIKDQKNLMFRTSWMMCFFMMVTSVLLTQTFGAEGLAFSMLFTELIVFIISTILNLKYNREVFREMFFKTKF